MIPTTVFRAMLSAVALVLFLPTLLASSGEGNIHLLEDEVGTALRSCSYNKTVPTGTDGSNRRSRSIDYDYLQKHHIPRIDDTKNNNMNLYGHERRNSTKQMYVLNENKGDTPRYVRANTSVKYVRPLTMPFKNIYKRNLARRKRNSFLSNKSNQDRCLSQCVFANLQVVDERGIPREAELWNKVQTALTSQQSRMALRDQVRACFQELQTEDDDNGCSYSNKLERCLMLRFSDRHRQLKSKIEDTVQNVN